MNIWSSSRHVAKLSVEFDVELKWRFGVQLKGSLLAMARARITSQSVASYCRAKIGR
jgi:hypothetical protein